MLPLVFVLGFIMFPFAIRAMPGGFQRQIAATIMSANEWDAGTSLMKAGNPDGWAQRTADTNLVDANREKIKACQDAATKSKRDERCTITVQSASEQ